MELTNKERAYLFERAFTESEALETAYSERFEAIGIPKNEFEEMSANAKTRLAYWRLLQRAYRKFDKVLKEAEAAQKEEAEFKKTALMLLYNNPDEEIYPEVSQIRALVKTVVNKFFAEEDLWQELDEIHKFTNSTNRKVALVAEGLEDVLLGKLTIRQCAECKNLFFPTPRGHEQKFCSNACKMREYRRRKKRKEM